MNVFSSLVEQCEKALRAGQITVVTELIQSIKTNSIPRQYRLPLANLCRRSGLWNEGLRFLGNLIRPMDGTPSSANDRERAEYAILLMKIGSVEEAKNILSNLKKDEVPELDMYRAFCEMALWNYDEAIMFLKKYLTYSNNGYQRLVARTNLVSALVWTERSSESEALLNELIVEAEKTQSLRLFANCLELKSQFFLQANDYQACESNLERARAILNSSSTSDQLFIQKWQSFCSALKNKSLAPIESFQQEAVRRHHWESIRECDFYTLKISFSEPTFKKLICGTPFESYRNKVFRTLGQSQSDGFYYYGNTNGPCLDLLTAQLTSGQIMKAGKKSHQLINSLLKDFYKPANMGTVFSDLFPDEYFDVFSSPGRIHKIVSRTRQFFTENNWPLKIEFNDQRFFLRIDGDFSFRIPFHRAPVSGPSAQIEKLKQYYSSNDRQFSADDVSKVLQLSTATARRILRWGVDHQKFIKSGAGPSTVYRLVS